MLTPKITNLLASKRFILIAYLLIAIIACLAKIALDFKPHQCDNYISKINNFIIYRNSYIHLINHQNLYGFFPAEQYDEFLYSPTFAILIAPFAWLPLYAGVILWCMFNAAAVYTAINLLPETDSKKVFIFWFVLIELITSIQNVQVNPIVASLFIFTFVAFEKKQLFWAAFFVVLSVYIKVFGILGASLFLIYPDRLRFLAYAILWSIVLFALPLLVISVDELLGLYQNWFHTLTADHAKNTEDVSAMRMLSGVSGIDFSEPTRLMIQVGAVVLFCVKYIRYSSFTSLTFRYFFLASAMIWSIIFNHAAESSTYIIAIAGVAIWYTHEKRNNTTLVLLIGAFILCSLSPTDIFPKFIRHNYVVPMALKSLPCLLIYLKLEYNMIFRKDFVKLGA